MDIRGFRLTAVPEDFHDDPYRYYAAARAGPGARTGAGAFSLSRYDDVVAVYRHPGASSDKKIEFKPKFGASPLYEHHTTSLVFNDPPLHTRVRGLHGRAQPARDRAHGSGRRRSRRSPARRLRQGNRFHRSIRGAHSRRGDRQPAGHPEGRARPLRAWSLAILSGLEPRPTAAMLERGNSAVEEFKQYLARLVAERRRRATRIPTCSRA